MENVTITLTWQQRLSLEWALLNQVYRLEKSKSVKHDEGTYESIKSILQIFKDKRNLVSAENELAWHFENSPDDHKAIAHCAKRIATLKARIQS